MTREPESRAAVEAIFRSEWGQLIATAMRLLRDLDRAEEVVQEVLVVALERWPFSGIPDKPGAWLLVATRNRALDSLRSDRVRREKQPLLEGEARLREQEKRATEADDGISNEQIADDRLRLIFTCCHPSLARESQVALTLRLLGGLSTREIAASLLAKESALAQRIVRAKKSLRDDRVAYRVPEPAELPERLPVVLDVLYLIFNEGYAAHEGNERLRPELCQEALRLGLMLRELLPDEAEVDGLVSLMTLHRAREATRVDPDGAVVLLQDQDRSRWDQLAIERAHRDLAPLVASRDAGAYVIQAAIASCHARARVFAATDWPAIVALYDRLLQLSPSPVIALNRIVAASMTDGPAAVLPELEALATDTRLAHYPPLEAARADLYRRLERWTDARTAYRRAAELSDNEAERRLLEKRAQEIEGEG